MVMCHFYSDIWILFLVLDLLIEVVSYCFSIFQIKEHLERECPNTEIKCPFHIVGCTYEVWQLFVVEKYRQHRAISRRVVGKSARINPERYCGCFWIHCSSKKFERMVLEAIDVRLRVLKESNNRRFDSNSARKSVLIISHITFQDCRVHIFSDNLTWNSCILQGLWNTWVSLVKNQFHHHYIIDDDYDN